MNNQSLRKKKGSPWARALRRILGIAPVKTSDNPQWAHLSADERAHCAARIQRLRGEYLSRYRRGGNLKLPEVTEIRDDAILTRCRDSQPTMTAKYAHKLLESAQIDILMKTLLMQLEQLEEVGYIHGALSPEHVHLVRKRGVCRGEITGLEHGHFADENEALPASEVNDYISPEACGRVRFPDAGHLPECGDVFSAGCLYHLFLTGRTLYMPAEAYLRMQPLAVSGMDGPRAGLIRWMLEPNIGKRPGAGDVLEAMNELQERGLLDGTRVYGERTSLKINGYSADCRRISSAHAENQCLAADEAGNMMLIRCMTEFWNPGERPDEGEGAFLARHRRMYEWNIRRIQLIAGRSVAWNRMYPLIAPCSAHRSRLWPAVSARLAGEKYIALAELHRYQDSVFLLDARMTEILFAVQTLHDDRFILGALSPALFGAKVEENGAQVELIDLSGAISLDDLPMPEAFMPGRETMEYLSPELAQYIVASPDDDSDEMMDLQERIGPASDIFALGLIYHLILTGRLPELRDPKYMSCGNAVCYEELPEDALILDESLDRKHKKLIGRMLRMNPLERPMRCDEIIRRILDFYTA